MTTYTEICDTIKEDRLIVEARKISDTSIIVTTGKYRVQRTRLKDDIACIVDKKLHFIKD